MRDGWWWVGYEMVVSERERVEIWQRRRELLGNERRKEKQNEKEGHAACFNDLGLLDEMFRLVTSPMSSSKESSSGKHTKNGHEKKRTVSFRTSNCGSIPNDSYMLPDRTVRRAKLFYPTNLFFCRSVKRWHNTHQFFPWHKKLCLIRNGLPVEMFRHLKSLEKIKKCWPLLPDQIFLSVE